MKEKDKIIIVGDIHGAYPRLRYDISRSYTDAYVIQVGDFGFGFHKPNYYKTELEDVSKTLTKTNCHLYVIRGNHDDHPTLQKLIILSSLIILLYLLITAS